MSCFFFLWSVDGLVNCNDKIGVTNWERGRNTCMAFLDMDNNSYFSQNFYRNWFGVQECAVSVNDEVKLPQKKNVINLPNLYCGSKYNMF